MYPSFVCRSRPASLPLVQPSFARPSSLCGPVLCFVVLMFDPICFCLFLLSDYLHVHSDSGHEREHGHLGGPNEGQPPLDPAPRPAGEMGCATKSNISTGFRFRAFFSCSCSSSFSFQYNVSACCRERGSLRIRTTRCEGLGVALKHDRCSRRSRPLCPRPSGIDTFAANALYDSPVGGFKEYSAVSEVPYIHSIPPPTHRYPTNCCVN